LFEPLKSADPPIRFGIFGVRTESIFSDEFLVAIDSIFLMAFCFSFLISPDILIFEIFAEIFLLYFFYISLISFNVYQ